MGPWACGLLVAVALAVVPLPGSGAESAPASKSSAAGKPRATQPSVRLDHRAYTIRFPAGWYPARFDPEGHFKRDPHLQVAQLVEAGEVSFADESGNYFVVLVDQAGDFEADAIWRLGPAADGRSLSVATECPMCQKASDAGAEDESCPAGDGRLSLGAPAIELRGHYFAFLFGNTKRESGVPVQVFRDIIRSFKAK